MLSSSNWIILLDNFAIQLKELSTDNNPNPVVCKCITVLQVCLFISVVISHRFGYGKRIFFLASIQYLICKTLRGVLHELFMGISYFETQILDYHFQSSNKLMHTLIFNDVASNRRMFY